MPAKSKRTTFTVRVEFSGLCTFIRHANDKNMASIVMPNAAAPASGSSCHDDGSIAAPHVAFIRWAVGTPSLGGKRTRTAAIAEPAYEVLHRLGHERIDLGLGRDAGVGHWENVTLPNFDDFASLMTLNPEVLSANPDPRHALARMVLAGGEFKRPDRTDKWKFAGDLNAGGKPTEKVPLSSSIRWERGGLAGEGIVLQLTTFGTGDVVEIPIAALDLGEGAIVYIKVSHLCERNPLEWPEYGQRSMLLPPGQKDDNDFKWLYRTVKPTLNTNYPVNPLPHPIYDDNRSELQDCFGARISTDLPLPA